MFSVQLELVEMKAETGTAESCQPKGCVPAKDKRISVSDRSPAFHLNNLITLTLMRSKSGSQPRLCITCYHALKN